MTRVLLGFACSLHVLALGCGLLSGIDDYEVVDCPTGNCADGSTAQDAAPEGNAPASDAPDATSIPQLDCTNGTVQVTVSVASTVTAGSVTLDSQFSVAPGGVQAQCLRPGTEQRLRTSDDSRVTFGGVSCKDGATGNRCDFNVGAAPMSITVDP